VGVLTCGVGEAKAHARTTAAIARWTPDRVISIGTCGALVDELAVGTVVTGTGLLRPGATTIQALCPLPDLPVAVIATVHRAVFDPARRAALAAQGAHVVEMEASGVAQAAQVAGLPFHGLKVVSDQAGADPEDLVHGEAGVFSAAQVARFMARALKLSETRLAPALDAAIRATGGTLAPPEEP